MKLVIFILALFVGIFSALAGEMDPVYDQEQIVNYDQTAQSTYEAPVNYVFDVDTEYPDVRYGVDVTDQDLEPIGRSTTFGDIAFAVHDRDPNDPYRREMTEYNQESQELSEDTRERQDHNKAYKPDVDRRKEVRFIKGILVRL